MLGSALWLKIFKTSGPYFSKSEIGENHSVLNLSIVFISYRISLYYIHVFIFMHVTRIHFFKGNSDWIQTPKLETFAFRTA